MKRVTKVTALLLVFALTIVLTAGPETVQAKVNCKSVYSKVKSAYGTSFPLSTANEIKTKRKNVFGGYSTILGVSAKYFKSYTAAKKSSSTSENVCFVCKASKKSYVKKIKKALKKYAQNEKKSNANYFSAYGKSLLSNYKVGSKGKYVYLFILDTNKNSKAVNAFKKSAK